MIANVDFNIPLLNLAVKYFAEVVMLQVIELQLPSFMDNFDPRAAAANFPSSN